MQNVLFMVDKRIRQVYNTIRTPISIHVGNTNEGRMTRFIQASIKCSELPEEYGCGAGYDRPED